MAKGLTLNPSENQVGLLDHPKHVGGGGGGGDSPHMLAKPPTFPHAPPGPAALSAPQNGHPGVAGGGGAIAPRHKSPWDGGGGSKGRRAHRQQLQCMAGDALSKPHQVWSHLEVI